MADAPEKSQKTEAPTQRRIDEARQKALRAEIDARSAT